MTDTELTVMFDQHIFASQRYGGISRMFVELAKAMPHQNVAARIAAPLHTNRYLEELPDTAFIGPHRCTDSRIALKLARMIVSRSGPAFARVAGADVVHETYFAAYGSAPAGTPCVTTIYDMIHEREADFAGDPVITRKAAAIARADWITCISHHTRSDLCALYPQAEAKSSVIHLAADMPLPRAGRVAPQRPYLIYVGERARPYKNFAALVSAFTIAGDILSGFDLVCVGGGPFTQVQQRILAEAGLAKRARQIQASDQDLADLYADAAALVYPSTYEGFGIPPLEAMLCACPVVTVRAASMPEICGNAASYAETPDALALSGAIGKVVGDPAYANELRSKGAHRARAFSWQECARQHAAVYRQLVETSS